MKKHTLLILVRQYIYICGVGWRTARMSDAAVLLTKKIIKDKNSLMRFKILKLVKHILNFLYIKFYDPGSFTLAVIVKTPIGT